MAKKDWMVIESELDEDQIRVLMATNDKSLIVSGCAGSGKSVLALLKAQRIQNEKGDNYKIIVFTKALCRYMNAGRKTLGLKNDFNYHEEWKWKKVLKQYGSKGSFWVYERDDDGNKIPNKPSADYFIVDEIQDFTEDEIQEFLDATNKNFFFFGDTAQSIYDGLKDTIKVSSIRQTFHDAYNAKEFELYRNYRLPRPVAKIVQYVGVDLDGFDINTYKSQETEIPRIIRYNNYTDQIDAIVRIVNNNQTTDIGILVPTNEDVRKIHDKLNGVNITHEIKYDDKENYRNSIDTLDFSTENPKVMTYHSAKGLQFGTVILPNVQPTEGSDQKALYVAMTRSYRNLYILYSDDFPFPPFPLSNIPSDLYKSSETDTIDDI